MPCKIAAIGTINKDTIYTPDGTKHESYGGLLYTMIPLAQMLDADCEILPILNLGRNISRDVMPLIRKYPAISHENIKIVSGKNNHCRLYYSDRESKKELLSGGVPGQVFRDIKPALTCEHTIVNFISGRDISIRTLEKFRRVYRGLIYVDIHSLTLGKRKSGERYFRKPLNWKRYCACADFLQMNREEFELLSGQPAFNESLKRFYSQFADGFLKALHVTCGQAGSCLAYKPGAKIVIKRIKAPVIRDLRDTTGCGDVFGAAFVASIVQGNSIYSSACFANDRAAMKCRFAGIESLRLHKPK